MNVLKNVTRVEIIDHTKPVSEGGGRTAIVNYTETDKAVGIDFQDEGRTLKVFIFPKETTVMNDEPILCSHQMSHVGRCMLCGEQMEDDE